jgi:hypothetical protein
MIKKKVVKIYAAGNEIPANVSALRGKHQDGSLRSILIQFAYSMAKGDVLSAQVIIDDGARKHPDPVYQKPTLEIVKNNNVIFPLGAEYLVSTNIYFRNLLPVGDGSTSEENFYTNLAENRFDALSNTKNWGTADYENVSAIIGLWCRFGGDIKYWNQALKQILRWLDYNTPNEGITPPCNGFAANPDGRNTSHNHCGIPAEWHSPRFYSFAQMYLLTGYRDFWGIVAYNVQYQQQAIDSKEKALQKIISNGKWDRPRFNYAKRLAAMIPAYMIDATLPVDGQYFSGRKFNWQDQFEWTINAIVQNAWNIKWIPFNNGRGKVPDENAIISQNNTTANVLGVFSPTMNHPRLTCGSQMPEKGYLQIKTIQGGPFRPGKINGISVIATGSEEEDYRQGLIGTRSNSFRNSGSGETQEIPIFQFAFITNFLIDYYLYIRRDERIPNSIKKVIDIIIGNMRELRVGDKYHNSGWGEFGKTEYGCPYQLYNPKSIDARPYTIPIHARALAFVLKTSGDQVVNGASYTKWFDRFINTGNVNFKGILNWQWKHFGQMYGWSLDTPWIMAQQNLAGYGPKKMRKPTQYDSIPDVFSSHLN